MRAQESIEMTDPTKSPNRSPSYEASRIAVSTLLKLRNNEAKIDGRPMSESLTYS